VLALRGESGNFWLPSVSLEQLLGERNDAAVLAVSRLLGFLHSRFAFCHSLKALTSTVSESAADY
jgi:hypothetical protein